VITPVFGISICQVNTCEEIDPPFRVKMLIADKQITGKAVCESVIPLSILAAQLNNRACIILNTDLMLKKSRTELEFDSCMRCFFRQCKDFTDIRANKKTAFTQENHSWSAVITDNLAFRSPQVADDIFPDLTSKDIISFQSGQPQPPCVHDLKLRSQIKISAESVCHVSRRKLCAIFKTQMGSECRHLFLGTHPGSDQQTTIQYKNRVLHHVPKVAYAAAT